MHQFFFLINFRIEEYPGFEVSKLIPIFLMVTYIISTT